MKIVHEEVLDTTMRQLLKDWHDSMYKGHERPNGFDELPEDHPDYQAVHQIRAELLKRGIDPATVYPVHADFNTRQDVSEPVTMTVIFDYK